MLTIYTTNIPLYILHCQIFQVSCCTYHKKSTSPFPFSMMFNFSGVLFSFLFRCNIFLCSNPFQIVSSYYNNILSTSLSSDRWISLECISSLSYISLILNAFSYSHISLKMRKGTQRQQHMFVVFLKIIISKFMFNHE